MDKAGIEIEGYSVMHGNWVHYAGKQWDWPHT
jgi:hypothetical protein